MSGTRPAMMPCKYLRAAGSSVAGFRSWLACSLEVPLFVFLKLQAPPMCVILARLRCLEARLARVSWCFLMPPYWAPVTGLGELPCAPT